MNVQTYKEQVNNPHIIDEVIKKLELDKLNINRRSLQNMISLDNVKDTNLITITIEYSDPEMAAKIANSIGEEFTKFVSNNAKKQATKSEGYVKEQLEQEKSKLNDTLVEYKKFLQKPEGTQELSKEVNSKLDIITKYKAKLIDVEVEEKKALAKLSKSKEILNSTPEKIELKKSLADNTEMFNTIKDSLGQGSKELYEVNVTEEILNSNYMSMKNSINNLETYLATVKAEKVNVKEKIGKTQRELESLQIKLAERHHEERIINEKVKFAQNTYDSFLKKYEEIRIAKTSAIGDAAISIVSDAVIPMEPAGPNKKLNVAIAIVLGLMIGVFVAFFMEYWKESEKELVK
jgi:uncharacterized protein involved in exopolysaccharide biosynthesis